MTCYGATLYESDDPYRTREVAVNLRARGVNCRICAGIDTYYRIIEVRDARDPAYARWCEEFSRWLHERFGDAP